MLAKSKGINIYIRAIFFIHLNLSSERFQAPIVATCLFHERRLTEVITTTQFFLLKNFLNLSFLIDFCSFNDIYTFGPKNQ